MIKSLIDHLPTGAHRDRLDRALLLFPGLLVSVVAALAATFLSEHYGDPRRRAGRRRGLQHLAGGG